MINNSQPKTPRKLLRGPFQPVLESALAAELTAIKQQRGPLAPVTVAVPTRLLGLHLQRALARALTTGHANVRFATLTDLLPVNQRVAAPLARELLCRQLAAALPADGYFAPVRDTKGFAAALLATFTDLDEAGMSTLPGKTPKTRELATVYSAYRQWLAQRDLTTEAELLRATTPATASTVLLYGFYDLNAAQRAFVQQLAPATIFFPTGNEFSEPLANWFQSQGYRQQQSKVGAAPAPRPLVISAPGESAEVREAVRAILDYLRAHPGKTFNDCAILCRSRDQYDAVLRDTLPALGIPAYFRGGRPLTEHRDARLLLLLLEVIRTDYSRAAVMELACHLGPNSRWDALTVELGIVAGRSQWENRLARTDAQPLAEFIRRLFAAGDQVPARGTWSALSEAVLAAFRQLGGAHEPVCAAVAGLAELDQVVSPIALETFAEFCDKALAAGREQPARFQAGGVFVGDVMGARGLNFDCVVVLGLVEKSFPRLVREDPLLLDAERAAISPALPLKTAGHAEERLLFALACGSAREQLVLSYPRLDAGTARPRVPSLLLLDATGASDFKALEKLPSYRRVPLSAIGQPALDEREFDLPVLPADDDYLAELSPLLLAGVQAERARWCEKRLTAHDGLVPARGALATTSATSLEVFWQCPFRYFLKQVLRLEPWEEPEAAVVIDPADLGTLYHRILELYFRDGGDLDAVIGDQLRQFEQHGVTGYPTVWAIKKEIVRQEITAFVAREQRRLGGDWEPGKFEVEFECEIAPVRLRGKIDRVDFSADGRRARVYDYKTGKQPRGLRDNALAGGEALQLPLYLLAAEQLWPGVQIEEAGYLYFTLRGGYRAFRFTRETLDERRAELTKLLDAATTMIHDGCFAQHATPEGCRSCDFRPVCGNGIVKLAERKAGDERLAAFHDVKENVS